MADVEGKKKEGRKEREKQKQKVTVRDKIEFKFLEWPRNKLIIHFMYIHLYYRHYLHYSGQGFNNVIYFFSKMFYTTKV